MVPDNKGESRQEIRLSNVGKAVAREEVAYLINDYFVNMGKLLRQLSTTLLKRIGTKI